MLKANRLINREFRKLIPVSFLDYWLVVTVIFFLVLLILAIQIGNTPFGSILWILTTIGILPLSLEIYRVLLHAKSIFFPIENHVLSLEGISYPTIAFLIPSYHEPFEVAKMTFDSTRDINYPGRREIIVVDNSRNINSADYLTWEAYVKAHAGTTADTRVVFAYNEREGGFKPGNLDLAQELIEDAEYVVFLDVDSTLPFRKGLLEESVAEFASDPNLGFIQYHMVATNEYFNSFTSSCAVFQNLIRIEHLLRGGYGGFSVFCGHNGIFRKSVLDRLGPWLEHFRGNVMVAEDALQSVKIYNLGYYGKYKTVPTGEWIPTSLDALESMWLRWTYGGQQVLFKYFRKILISKNFLPLERLDFLAFTLGYFSSTATYLLIILWTLFLTPGKVFLGTIVLTYLPILVYAISIYQKYLSKLRIPFWRKLWYLYAGSFCVKYFISLVQMKAIFNFLIGRKQGWKVTTKSVENTLPWSYTIRRHGLTIFIGSSILIVTFIMWGLRFSFSSEALLCYFPNILNGINLLLCVGLFGRQGRNAANQITRATIDEYREFRQKKWHGSNQDYKIKKD